MLVNKARMEVLDSVIQRLHFAHDWNVQVVDTSPLMSRKPEFELNWWACGTVSAEDALTFKAQMDFCIALANKLNSLDITIVEGEDNIVKDIEDYDRYVDVVTEYIIDHPVHSEAVKFIVSFLKAQPSEEQDKLEEKRRKIIERIRTADEVVEMVCRHELDEIDRQVADLLEDDNPFAYDVRYGITPY